MYTDWQMHVLKTLWSVREIGNDDAKGMGALVGGSAKVAGDKLRRSGLVERIERGPFAEPGYRLTPAGLDAARELFEPAPAGGEAQP